MRCLIKSKTMRKAFLWGIVCFLTVSVVAQNDSIVELQGVSKETKEEVEKKHSPKTASILSAIMEDHVHDYTTVIDLDSFVVENTYRICGFCRIGIWIVFLSGLLFVV